MSRDRRAVVVGAGISGLAAGVLLARRGLAVQVFEAASKVGGCCSSTVVEGYRFHDGAITLGLPRLLDAGFARLGLNRERLLPLRTIDEGYWATFEDGRSVRVCGGRVSLVAAKDGRAVHLDGAVAALLERWRPMCRVLTENLLQHPFSLWRALRLGGRDLLKLRGTVGIELRRAFADETVQAALAGFLLYAGLPPDQLPAASMVGLVALLDEGFYLPAGGMGRIPEVLAAALRAHGGEIHTQAPVERIAAGDGRVRGVETAGHGYVGADVVVSGVSGMITFGRLLKPQDVPRALRRQVARAPLSHTALCIQLGLRNRCMLPAHGAILPPLQELHRVFERTEADRWLNWYVPTATVPELAPAGGSIVEMFCPLARGVVRSAADDAEQADRVIAALAHRHPLEVAVRRVRGPLAFRDELRLFDGALYGLSPAAGPAALLSHRTPIAGLFQAGQTTYPGYGVNPALMSGILAAEEVLAS